MPITERTLRKWRRESLKTIHGDFYHGATGGARKAMMEKDERILRLTQELLDQHLLRKDR